MKILEAQSANLSNYEVYTHILDTKKRYGSRSKNRKLGPGNLETLMKELLLYFHTAPSPLAQNPIPYNDQTLRTLGKRLLTKFDLTKSEFIMILNHRPVTLSNLTFIVEEFELRFPEEEVQQEMLDIIAEILGIPDGEAERKAMEDGKEAEQVRAADVKSEVNTEDA